MDPRRQDILYSHRFALSCLSFLSPHFHRFRADARAARVFQMSSGKGVPDIAGNSAFSSMTTQWIYLLPAPVYVSPLPNSVGQCQVTSLLEPRPVQ